MVPTLRLQELVGISKESSDINQELSRLVIDPSNLHGSLEIIERAFIRTEIMLDSAKAVSSSLVLDQVFSALTKIVVPRMADWWCVWLSDQTGTTFRYAAAFHVDPTLNFVLQRLAHQPTETNESVGPTFVMATGKAELIETVDVHRVDQLIIGGARGPLGPKKHSLVTELGVTSYLAVPILAENHTRLGVIAFGNSSLRHHLSQDDVSVGSQIASLVAQAIKNAGIYSNILNDTDRLRFERECRNEFVHHQIHELRTLMTTVLLVLELVQRNLGDPERAKMLTEKAKDAILKVRTLLVYDESELEPKAAAKKAK